MRKPPCPPLSLALEHLEDRRLLAVVPWSGDIPDGTVWRAGDVQHLTADVRVPAGATLTVQPGAVIKFGSFSIDLVVAGTLAASGTSGQPIVFTEFRDDTAGGDTNGDGANSLPSPSNWGRIEVQPTGSATLAHAQIRYGGFNSLGQVTVDGGQLTLTDSTISRSASDGVRIQASQPTLTNNAYLDNGNAALSMDLASNPAISGVIATGNPINGLQVDGGTLSGQRFWNDPDITYVTDGDIIVASAAKLTVAPGQVVKFGSFFYDLFVEGTLDAQGTVAAPIVFTEFRDDSAGGDTNNDGNNSDPAPGNWGHVALQASSVANLLDHVEVRYGGFNATGIIQSNGGPLQFRNGVIRSASGSGVFATEGSQVSVTNSLLLRNGQAGVAVASGATLTAVNNTIDGNFRGAHADGATSTLILTNNLLTFHGRSGVFRTNSATVQASYNDVFNPAAGATNYEGLVDLTDVNGNFSADPLYVSRTDLRYDLLRRSPALDTADSNVAPATDSQGMPRFNDPGVDDLGVGPIPFVDVGALERQDVSDPLNLVIESPGVSAAQVQIDDTITIQWMVRNNEFVTAEGSWVDAVFVSQDDRWDLSDTLVHRSTHTGGLAAGQAYSGQAQFLVPPKREGTLYFIIRTDSQRALRESLESDNEAVISSQLTIPELTVGSPANSSFTATATRRFFRITPPDNRTVEFHLDSAAASGTTGLYVREGALPSLTEFDAKGTAPSPDQDATVPESGGRTIYVLAQAGAGPATTATFALSAALPGFQVREVTPAVVGNSGNVTLQIRGTDLTRITEVTLISSDNVIVPAVATYFGDANHLLATFNLTGMPAGHFDVRVHSAAPYADFSETGQLIIRTQTDGDVTLADAVEVRAVSSNSATVNLLLPSVARFGQVIPFHVEVRNDGINDIPIPVILVRSANGTPLSTSSIVSATSPTQLQILPLGDEGPPTVLRPGTSLRIPLFGLALKEPASQIAVQTMPSDATAIPWDSYEATYRDDTPAAEWAVTWSNFKTMVGGTLASLHQVMRRAAEELATTRRAATFVSADEIIKLLLNYASAGETTVANFLSFPTGMDDPDPLSLLNPTSPQGEWGPVGTAPEPEPESDPPADNNRDTCASWRPRSSVVLAAMEAWAETAVIAAVSARNGTFASSLFVEYLQNSSPKYEAYPSSHVIVQGNPLHEGFKDSSVTLNVIQTVWDDAIREIKRRLTPGLWGTIPADKRLDINTMGSFESIPLESIFRPEQLDSALSPFSTQREGANPAIYYADALHYGGDGDTFSIPNAIAGGVGKTDPDESPQVSYGSDQFGDDRRKITGEIILRKTTSPDGQTVTVTAESLFRLFVKDTVDFCPGDLGEGLPVRAATVPLKSLEANGWAFDVGFETEFATKGLSAFVVRKNVTEPPTSCELNPGTQGGEGEASSCTDTGQTVRTVRSRDPNDITGPAGFGDQGWILPETLLPYKVRFENDPQQATAPALDVVVTNQLDSDMDWSTFELGSIGFGSLVVDVPPGLSSYSTSVESANLDGTPLQVDISAMLNADTGLVTVSFRSIDPATGLPPLDPLAGFLPPNDTTHRGEGFFTYFVFPKSGLPTGTRLENAASIVFDTNEPIVTNTALNTIDRGPPSSQVNALPATSVTPFVVTWTGTDDAGGSGIASYDIYVSDNGGSFALFLDDTTNTSTSFAGIAGHTYQFYSIATDNLGFVEVPPAQPDAQTTAAAGPAWQNPRNRRDPTNDGNVVPQDVLVIVNELNLRRFSNPVTGQLGPRTAEAQFFYDVNGDNFATPNDVLVIINFLNAGGGEGEQAETASAQDTVTWWLGAWLAMSPSSVPTTSPRAPSRLPQMPSARDDVFAEWPAAASVPLSDGPTGGSIARIAKGLSSTRSLASGPSDTDADTSMTEDIRLRAPRRSRTSDTP